MTENNKINNKENALFESMKTELEVLSKSNLRMYNKALKLIRKIDREGRRLCSEKTEAIAAQS